LPDIFFGFKIDLTVLRSKIQEGGDIMNPTYQYDYSTGADAASGAMAGGILAAFAGAMFLIFIIGIAVYVYMAICLMKMAKKTNTDNGWFAWIPILNLILLIWISKKPMWWIILFFIPIANIVAMIVIWMAVAEQMGKPSWVGVLMIVPIANLIIPGYLAFSKSETAQPTASQPTQPTAQPLVQPPTQPPVQQ
jgi:hypothetical protein